MNIPPNPELQLAHDFVEYTDRNIFLTGKAGTGKTTFLHNMKKNTHKRMIVTAPTGVAAINAGGVTLHSFFQLPFGPFVPGSEDYGRHNQHRFSKEKINIVRSLDLLVIDEISMVRADLLDGVDSVLRHYRRNDLPFGGVQLLMIGDLQQLSPVVKEDDRAILRDFYDSMYFFGCRALSLSDLVVIELKHIYRQSDGRFIDLLNRVRDNQLDQASLHELNSRYRKNFRPGENDGTITLSTHNRSADAINESRLKALPEKPRSFRAEVEGDFPEYSYPTSLELTLKKGAQVMFVKNDPSPGKLYFNGKIGKITRMTDQSVSVKCPGDEGEITVEPAIWENIKYRIDPATAEITEDKVGSFVQLPLKLAWAITIHKSQGLTFDRAVIDAGAAFAHGQVYVALSRCKTFEGLVLSSPIPGHAIKTDGAVSQFIAQTSETPPSVEKLQAAKILYQQRLLTECFDFSQLRGLLGRFIRVLRANARTVSLSGAGDLQEMEDRARAEIFVVSEKFHRQLTGLFADDKPPEADPAVLDRTTRAGVYFEEKLNSILGDRLAALRIDTDNKEIAKIARVALDELKKETAVKLAAARSCKPGFSPARYLRALSSAEIDLTTARETKNRTADTDVSEIGAPELLQALKDWRAAKAGEAGLPHYQILHQSVLMQIAATLPDSPAALMSIRGIGKRLCEKYGQELLALVSAYRQKHGISGPVRSTTAAPKPPATGGKTAAKDTRQITYELFSKGLTVAQVARERGLAHSTIEGHLTCFVETGRLDVGKLIPEEKLKAIDQRLMEMKDKPLGEIKQSLGDSYSYGEIRLVQAHRNYLATGNATKELPA
ncbi:helix-turn-helix domain-containing protein [Desulforhabdus sp. TSK]|uniref:helix-turn-helix domain-containing protein n=1 Tax=Desulforhabdus sp. TSK TaxID=2925014 RepID=UPI00208C986B|nr:helix-turn-helix domain-containing protein [Desulforhabdus sp. TSK]GKT09625.1 helicase [Desulforhabdus sp. TSK]